MPYLRDCSDTQVRDLLAQVAGFQRLFDDDRQFVEIERLVDIVIGAHAHRLDRGFQHAERGHHDDDDLLVNLLNFFQHLQAVYAGKLDVEQDQFG